MAMINEMMCGSPHVTSKLSPSLKFMALGIHLQQGPPSGWLINRIHPEERLISKCPQNGSDSVGQGDSRQSVIINTHTGFTAA